MDKGLRWLLYNIIVVKTLFELPCNFACNRFVSYHFHIHFHFCGSCCYLAFERLLTSLYYVAGIDTTYCWKLSAWSFIWYYRLVFHVQLCIIERGWIHCTVETVRTVLRDCWPTVRYLDGRSGIGWSVCSWLQ